MSASKIEGFLTERGVLAPPPDRPRETYAEHWNRTVKWLALAEKAKDLVQTYGAEEARSLINMALGVPSFSTDHRLILPLDRQGTYGFALLPGGCRWALEKDRGGQCSFCEFQEMVDLYAGSLPFSHEEFMALFTAGFETMRHADIMNVFTAGSFLNPGEMPMETQAGIARIVAANEQTSILRVESRVQYMVPETIVPLVDIMRGAGKTLDIAIGFETQDDYLRNKVLRKGMGREGFVNAVKAAKAAGARVSVYVILMPVAMNEGFAIKECIESIRFAFQAGADEVLLQARYSHYADMQCPKLWSIAQVLRETAQDGPVMLGKWEGELPPPVVWPKNCDVCTPAVMHALREWRKHLRPYALSDNALPDCDCKLEWRDLAANEDPPPRGKAGLPVIS